MASPAAASRTALTMSAGGGVFQQEPACPGPEGAEDVLVEMEGGQHDHFGRVGKRGDLPGGSDAVHAGHAHVHQRHVHAVGADGGDGGGAIGGLGNHVQVAGG
jgi:hypothetical protein